MSREYDFGEGGKIKLTGRTGEHADMFAALTALGAMGARVAVYINELKGQINRRNEVIAGLKEYARVTEDEQIEEHREILLSDFNRF
mgnify:CR=1 FL=1